VTPAGRLRAAADTIDHTANAATPGPWESDGSGVWVTDRLDSDHLAQPGADAEVAGCYADRCEADTAHVALWDPPTALLTARMLRTIAGYVDEADRLGLSVVEGDLTGSALELADAILTDAWIQSDAPLQLPTFDRNTQTREHPHHADPCPQLCPLCDGIIAAQDHT
jgi:hypothetical protein